MVEAIHAGDVKFTPSVTLTNKCQQPDKGVRKQAVGVTYTSRLGDCVASRAWVGPKDYAWKISVGRASHREPRIR
jgi:hypothetical protein